MADEKVIPGRVYAFEPGREPPTSSLPGAFVDQDGLLADAVVLRGYLGRSPILLRAREYLEAAKAAASASAEAPAAKGKTKRDAEKDRFVAADDAPFRATGNAPAVAAEAAQIQGLIDEIDRIRPDAQPHVPWRIYLTPALNRWVDFHLSALLAWRQEPKMERRDTFTVWLRAFDPKGKPVPYRIVQETTIGPSFATYLGGDLVDDFLDGSAGSGSAWGDQAGGFGNRPATGKTCLNS